MALEGRSEVHRLEADLGARELVVLHKGDRSAIADLVRPLNLGAEILETTEASELDEVQPPSSVEEARTLKMVLAINAGMFAGEAMSPISSLLH